MPTPFWGHWLPQAALQGLLVKTVADTEGRSTPWPMVRGPFGAMVATAHRLGWQLATCTSVVDDLGFPIDLTVDPPAMVRQRAIAAVWRWRWRRFEARMPCLAQEGGGRGPFIQPLFRLIAAPLGEEWGSGQKGALRSVLSRSRRAAISAPTATTVR